MQEGNTKSFCSTIMLHHVRQNGRVVQLGITTACDLFSRLGSIRLSSVCIVRVNGPYSSTACQYYFLQLLSNTHNTSFRARQQGHMLSKKLILINAMRYERYYKWYLPFQIISPRPVVINVTTSRLQLSNFVLHLPTTTRIVI